MNGGKKWDWQNFRSGFMVGFLIALFVLIFTSLFVLRGKGSGAEINNGEQDFGRLIIGEWQSKFQQDGETIVIKMVFSPKIKKEKEVMSEGTVVFSIISRNIMVTRLSVPNKLLYAVENDKLLLFLDNYTEWGRIKIINLNGKTMKLVEIDNSNGEPIQKVLTYSRISY